MMDEINHINTKVDEICGKVDKLKTQCEVYETQLTDHKHQQNGLMKTSEEIHSHFLLNVNMTRQMAKGIKDVRRATSLLATTKVSATELPYVTHCDQASGVTEEDDYVDACIQTRITELYSDLNSILNGHVNMLMDGPAPNDGRVEVIFNGRHGTICQSIWDYNESKVVCRMLGYNAWVCLARPFTGIGLGTELVTFY